MYLEISEYCEQFYQLVCNYPNKDKYNTFVTNITRRYNLDKKRIDFSVSDRQYCFKKEA